MVEKDLFEYIKLKPSIKREGVDELIQYCKQKDSFGFQNGYPRAEII